MFSPAALSSGTDHTWQLLCPSVDKCKYLEGSFGYNGPTIRSITSITDLDELLYPLAIPVALRPQSFRSKEGFFTRFAKRYPREVQGFVRAVNILLPLALQSGILDKKYPLLKRVSAEVCAAAKAIGTNAPIITQQFKLSRLEIALLNLLSSFGYSRQGYPRPADGDNEANDYTLIKYFMDSEGEGHHVYALSMMGYLTVIAEELVGARLLAPRSSIVKAGIFSSCFGGDQEEKTESTSIAIPEKADLNLPSASALMSQMVTFTRRSHVPTPETFTTPAQAIDTPKVAPSVGSGFGACQLCPVTFKDGSMFESSETTVVVDYANEYFGGPSTLTSTQEEILLMLKPEMLPGRQLCEVMFGHEAINVDDARLFCSVTGYGHSTRIADVFPPVFDPTLQADPQTNWSVPVIDAIVHRSQNSLEFNQFSVKNKLRCTHKAFLSFEHSVETLKHKVPSPPSIVAGGRWGCGVFNGDLHLKVMQQWVAASAAGADRLDLFLFNDKLQPKIEQLVASWKGCTVGEVFERILAVKTESCYGPVA